MIISVTERGTFKRCRQMWDYSSFNRQHLTAKTPPTALSFGTLIHKTHEEWLLHPDEEVNDIVIKASVPALRDLKTQYKQMVGVEADEREFKSFYEQTELALNMTNNYKQMWGSSLPEGYRLLQPEQTLVVEIPNTKHCTKEGCWEREWQGCELVGHPIESHYLELTLDGLIADADGRLWVLERKTFANHPRSEDLYWNDQFIGYLWGLSQAFPDVEIAGVFYDGMWKRDGSKHSLPELFHRELIVRSQEELETWERELTLEALDMAEARIYRTIPTHPALAGCRDCQFVKLCQAEMRGEDSEYIKETYYTQRERHQWSQQTE